MSSVHHQPSPETPGRANSAENAPQVVVRAGKTFVCSACGTLVEIPEDVVAQLVNAVVPSSPQKSVETEPVDPTPAPSKATHADVTARISKPNATQPRRPKHPPRPEPVSLVGEMIEGLRVPSGKQLDRALAWVSFHLKVLDRQGSELHRLKKQCQQHRASPVPCPRPRGHANMTTARPARGPSDSKQEGHAHEDVSIKPEPNQNEKRIRSKTQNPNEKRNHSESKNPNEQERGPP